MRRFHHYFCYITLCCLVVSQLFLGALAPKAEQSSLLPNIICTANGLVKLQGETSSDENSVHGAHCDFCLAATEEDLSLGHIYSAIISEKDTNNQYFVDVSKSSTLILLCQVRAPPLV